MDDFIFRGRHIREFGAVAAFGETMKTGGKVRRGEYALPGGGSALIGEDEWQSTTRSVTITPEDGRVADGPWRRELLGFLQGGRGELIVDNDPDVIRIASFDAEATYEYKSWPAGCLTLGMTLQPLAYAAAQTQRTQHVQPGAEAVIGFVLDGALPSPLQVTLRATGGTITRARLRTDGRTLELPNLRLAPGHVLTYDGGQFLGDPTALLVDGAVDFSPVQGGRWARLSCPAGGCALSVLLEGGEADVSVSARGRWPA